jgi:hypothetical protein
MNDLKKRWNSPTPKFWKKVQEIGVMIGSLGLILATPPIGLSVIGGYMITAGSIVGVLSQLTIEGNDQNK